MRTTQTVATCLLAALLIGVSPAPAHPQTLTTLSSLRSEGGNTFAWERALSDSRATRLPGRFDARAPRGFVPHRHWSWLFPHSAVAPFASDPLERRHRWQDPLLRRHWWQ